MILENILPKIKPLNIVRMYLIWYVRSILKEPIQKHFKRLLMFKKSKKTSAS